MQKKKLFIPGLVVLLAVLIVVYGIYRKNQHLPTKTLAIYGEKELNGTDTIYHTIPAFSFIDQEGKTVNEKTVEGKIFVTDYFFTTCHSICPIMSTQMERIAEHFTNNPEVIILSHTVDPETDSVQALAEYAKKHNANVSQWHFLTGDKKDLYKLAREGYYLDAEEGDGGPDDFIHTQNFALVDKNRMIRGYYDGTDSLQVSNLIQDIQILIDELHTRK